MACSALAGCGGKPGAPALARADTAQLVSLAGRIAAEGPCAQRRDITSFRARALRLVRLRRVPVELQAPFVEGVNALVADVPPCVRAVPATEPAAPPDHGNGHGKHGPGRGHGHGHGHGKDGD